VAEETVLNEAIAMYGSSLTSEQIRAIPYLAHGVTAKDVAQAIGVSPSTISSWKTRDIEFSLALEKVRAHITDWHVANLHKVGVYAWDVLSDLMSTKLKPGQAGFSEQVNAAKFVVGKMNLVPEKKQVDHNLTSPEMNISDSSADIVARRIMELEDKRIVNAEYVGFSVDILSEESVRHPDTEYGTMGMSDDGRFQCHVCGEWHRKFVDHIQDRHQMTSEDYRHAFGVDSSVVFIGEGRVDIAEEL